MLRLQLIWLFLLNYLLVVGAGLLVSRPVDRGFSAVHPYVHSAACQQHNYLRLDCFEHCNGSQHTVRYQVPTGTGLHYLAQLKGLDVHYPVTIVLTVLAPTRRWLPSRHPGTRCPAVPARTDGRDYPPPQRG